MESGEEKEEDEAENCYPRACLKKEEREESNSLKLERKDKRQ